MTGKDREAIDIVRQTCEALRLRREFGDAIHQRDQNIAFVDVVMQMFDEI